MSCHIVERGDMKGFIGDITGCIPICITFSIMQNVEMFLAKRIIHFGNYTHNTPIISQTVIETDRIEDIIDVSCGGYEHNPGYPVRKWFRFKEVKELLPDGSPFLA
jgi:hypothetical protein